MKAVVAAFNQEKALVGAFSVIVQPVVEPMDRFAALVFWLTKMTNVQFLVSVAVHHRGPQPAPARTSRSPFFKTSARAGGQSGRGGWRHGYLLEMKMISMMMKQESETFAL